MSESHLTVIRQPTCRHMLSKGMFVSGTLDPEVDDIEHISDGYCWCYQSAVQMGPDNKLVERAACSPGRQCYEARL